MAPSLPARRAVLAALLACGLTAVAPAPGRAEAPPLKLAVVPFFSAHLLFTTYEPLRAALEERLGRPVTMETAADYRTFAQRTQAGLYPFILTAPHLGRLAQLEAGYRPILQWQAPLRGVFVVGGDSPCRTLEELRGKTISTPDPLAAVTMLGRETLVTGGLEPGRDVVLVSQISHDASLLAATHGETAAALLWDVTLAAVAPERQAGLRRLATTSTMHTSAVFMAGPGLSAAEQAAVRDALLAFVATDAGRDFLRHSGTDGLVPVAEGGLAEFDRLLPTVRRLLTGAGR